MNDRLSVPVGNMFTLGVDDYQRQRDFYRNLGLAQVFDSEDFAVFEMRGALLALFPAEKLANDARAPAETARTGIRFSIIISVESPQDVDHWAERAVKAGARVTKEPTDAEFFNGRDMYFADPEDNYWEVAWAPADNPVVEALRRAATTRLGERLDH